MQEHGRHTTIVEIQHLRMVAVLLVVLAHIHQADARFLTTTLLDQTAYFGFAGVDVFFVLSGFIIHHLYRDYRGLDVRYFLKRLNRIFPLYWIFTGLTLAGYLVFAGSLTRSFAELDLIASLTLTPHHDLPILLVGWTLTHELYFYALFGLALALPPVWRVRAAGLWAAATIAATVLMPRDVSPWLSVAFSPFNLLFLSGIALSVLRDRLPAWRWPLTVVARAGLDPWRRARCDRCRRPARARLCSLRHRHHGSLAGLETAPARPRRAHRRLVLCDLSGPSPGDQRPGAPAAGKPVEPAFLPPRPDRLHHPGLADPYRRRDAPPESRPAADRPVCAAAPRQGRRLKVSDPASAPQGPE